MTSFDTDTPLIDSFVMPNFTGQTTWTPTGDPEYAFLTTMPTAGDGVTPTAGDGVCEGKTAETAVIEYEEAKAVASEPEADMRSKLESLLITRGRKMLIRLDPRLKKKAIWFKHDPKRHISKSIIWMMKSKLKKAYKTYTALPPSTKEEWFLSFAEEFHWDPVISKVVQKEFDAQASYTFSKTMSEWKRKWLRKKRAFRGIDSGFWKGLKKLWRSKKACEVAARNSENSKGGKRENKSDEAPPAEVPEDRDLALDKIEKLEGKVVLLSDMITTMKAEIGSLREEIGRLKYDSDETQA